MMLPFLIAKTHLLAKPKQTIVAMMGVTFGIGMFIALVSLMTGLNDFTESLTMTSSPDIHIYNDVTQSRANIIAEINPSGINQVYHQKPKNETAKLHGASEILQTIRKDPRVQGVAPMLASQVFYNYGPVQLNGNILGVEILEEDKLFDLRSKMKSGRMEDLLNNHSGILIGTGLARKLNAHVGDRVVITTPAGNTLTLKVLGTFQMGLGAVDNVRSYANISTVQAILQKPIGYITDINIKLKNTHDAAAIARELESAIGYKAEDWEAANATFLTGNKIRNIITYSVSVTLLIVAGFGIYNILNMTIYNKMKDIAILKATGFSGKDVRLIFMIQSLVIGFVGSLGGLLIGFVLSLLISRAHFPGGDFISLDRFPVLFDPLFYVVGVIFGVTTTAIAGYMPSRKAAAVDPIEILRG